MIDSHFGARKRLSHSVWFALALGAGLFTAGEAAAQQACGESTCAKGTVCQTVPSACPAIDCVGPDCKPCVPNEQHYCAPAPCTLDAECGSDQKCAEETFTECTGGAVPPSPACPPDADCIAPLPQKVEPENCTTTTTHHCAPRWSFACNVAADCGAGFECVPQESCRGGTSSGSSGSGSAPAGAPTPNPSTPSSTPFAPLPTPAPGAAGAGSSTPPSPGSGGSSGASPPADSAERPALPPSAGEVICEPTGYSACKRIVVACNADTDCLAGWSCRDNPEGACWSSSDGSSGCSADPPKVCLPPSWDFVGGRGLGFPTGVAEDGSAVPGSPAGLPGTGNASSGSDVPTAAPGPSPEAPQGAPIPPAAPALGNANPEGDSDESLSAQDGGCAMGSTQGSTALAWLALGLSSVFAFRRRR